MKSQIPIFNNKDRFEILKLGTRPQDGESKRSADNFGHCDLFDICDLLFGIFSHSSTQVLQDSSQSLLAKLCNSDPRGSGTKSKNEVSGALRNWTGSCNVTYYSVASG